MISNVTVNRRKGCFSVTTPRGTLEFPFSRLRLKPASSDDLTGAYVDRELGRQGFTYRLSSGREDSVLLDQVLEYNRDAEYVRERMLYDLTLLAQEALRRGKLTRRQVIRRMRTSPTQFYRLIDQTNTRKSLDEMVRLLTALDVPPERYWRRAA